MHRIHFVFTLTMFSSCLSIPKSELNIKGNWRTCSRDGIYTEMYVLDSVIVFRAVNGISYVGHSYLNYNDTLVYQITYENDRTQPAEKKVKLLAPNDSVMIWEYLNPHEQWKFLKLNEEIKLPLLQPSNNNHILVKDSVGQIEFLKRSQKYKCLDSRTKNEIIQDSIERSQFKF